MIKAPDSMLQSMSVGRIKLMLIQDWISRSFSLIRSGLA